MSTFFAQWSAPIVDCQWSNVGRVTIDMLPEIALLDIFDFYGHEIDAWHTLVHVCRNGESSSLVHHVAWICDFSAQPAHL